MMTTRSASATTSRMLWLIRMTVRRSALSLRMRSSTSALSLTPRAAVGSSMMMISAFQRSAREIATAWRCPPESRSTGRVMSVTAAESCDR